MIEESIYPYRLGLQQRVLPRYRAEFFDSLAAACKDGLNIFAGKPRPKEAIETIDSLQVASLTPANNIHLFYGKFYFCFQQNLLKWLYRWDPLALIVEANPRYLSTASAVRWMHRRNRRVVGWGLGLHSSTGLWGNLQSKSRQKFINQFDALITYSQQGAEEYRLAGFPPEKIFIAPNAVTHKPNFPFPDRPILPGKQPRVLFVGRLQDRKRVDLLLQACAALPTEIQPALRIVGDGPARQGLQKLAETVYPSAEFTGSKHGAELEPFFLDADLFVLPGTGGLAVQQAMSFGLPVVVGEADGTQRDLVRASNGWQIQPGNLEALSVILRLALSDLHCLRCMGEASYRIVSQEINIEAMVRAFMGALR